MSELKEYIAKVYLEETLNLTQTVSRVRAIGSSNPAEGKRTADGVQVYHLAFSGICNGYGGKREIS